MEDLLLKAQQRNNTVVICHPFQETLRVLKEKINFVEENNLELVFASQIVRWQERSANESEGVDQVKADSIEQQQKDRGSDSDQKLSFQLTIKPEKKLMEGKNLESKGQKTAVSENRHLKHSPRIQIGKWILPVRGGPEIPEFPQNSSHQTSQNPAQEKAPFSLRYLFQKRPVFQQIIQRFQ